MTTGPAGPAPGGPAGPGPGRDAFTTNPPRPRPPLPPPPPAPTRATDRVRAGYARDGAGAGQLPTLAELVAEAKLLLTQAIDSLGRQWDPASAPAEDAYLYPSAVDLQLSMAVADIRTALRELGVLNRLTPVMFPTRPTPGPASTAPSVAAGESDTMPPVVAGADLRGEERPVPGTALSGTGLPHCSVVAGPCPGDDRGVICRTPCDEFAPMAAGFVLPRPPEFSMRSALNAALNRRT